jgi:hypothetical protein
MSLLRVNMLPRQHPGSGIDQSERPATDWFFWDSIPFAMMGMQPVKSLSIYGLRLQQKLTPDNLKTGTE